MRVAVALSGGADSMALTLALKEWADKKGYKLTAITVDHKLRPESTEETKWIEKELKRHKVDHVTLTWEGQKPETGIQEAARKARYRLMADYCFTHGIPYLCVAHTKNDQAETFIQRLLKKSGYEGLSGMSAVKNIGKVTILRPFLKTERKEVIDFLNQKKQKWLEDPTNKKDIYERNRIRKADFDSDLFEKIANKFAKMRQNTEKNNPSYKVRNGKLQMDHPINSKNLKHLLRRLGQTDYPPKREKLRYLLNQNKGATLNHCIIRPNKKGISIKPESKGVWAFCLEDRELFAYLDEN